jgi:uncharacterized protein
MRYLILLGIVLGVIWWIKLNRATSQRQQDDNETQPQNMVRCAHCGLHLPENEAIHSRNAVYCSDAHRALAEN